MAPMMMTAQRSVPAAAAPTTALPLAGLVLHPPAVVAWRRAPAPGTGASTQSSGAAPRAQRRAVQASARAGTREKSSDVQDRIATQTIDDLSEDFCDDFECTSSPAIEQTVRSFARDTQRLQTYSAKLFQPDVKYEDGFRSFQGSGKYAKQRFWADNVQKPTVTIVKMRMLDKGTAQVDWRVQGALGSAGQVDLPVTSTIQMNLLTGRITSHKEKWDVSKLSPPAALLATLTRAAWSLRASTTDASEGAGKAISDSLSSLDGDSSQSYYNNPADPTRFFQNQGDNQWQDYVSFATLAALLYLVYRAYGELAQIS